MDITSEILIVARTRMSHNNVCIGGFDLTNQVFVRLLTQNGGNHPSSATFGVGEVYLVTYRKRVDITPPHTEDICIKTSYYIGEYSLQSLRDKLARLSLKNLSIIDLFQQSLTWERSGFLLEKQENMPNHSVEIVTLSHDLYMEKGYNEQIYFTSPQINGRFFQVKYVGTRNVSNIKIIQAGSPLRFSLARWWGNNGNYYRRRAYLQLSEIY